MVNRSWHVLIQVYADEPQRPPEPILPRFCKARGLFYRFAGYPKGSAFAVL
jgi:hypothetical protein